MDGQRLRAKNENSEPQHELRRHHLQPQQQLRRRPTRDFGLHEACEAIVRQHGRLAGCSCGPGGQVLGLLHHVGQVGGGVVLWVGEGQVVPVHGKRGQQIGGGGLRVSIEGILEEVGDGRCCWVWARRWPACG